MHRILFEGRLRSLSEISKKIGFGKSTISKYMTTHGVTPEEAVSHYVRRSRRRHALYRGEKASFAEIAGKLGRSPDSINAFAGRHMDWTAQEIADAFARRCEAEDAAPRGPARPVEPVERQEARARKLLGAALPEAEKLPIQHVADNVWKYGENLLEWTAVIGETWDDVCLLRCALHGKQVQEWRYYVLEAVNKNGETQLAARKAEAEAQR